MKYLYNIRRLQDQRITFGSTLKNPGTSVALPSAQLVAFFPIIVLIECVLKFDKVQVMNEVLLTYNDMIKV